MERSGFRRNGRRPAARVASIHDGTKLRAILDGEVLGTFDVPNTGGWQNWQTVTLTGLDILDHLGQRTEIRFEPEDGVTMDAATFTLEVPPGTDVIGG